ncbi:MAG: adenylate kinase [Chloroflexi bacterium]|nr:adenylate kinase [Chloroflexota bacterium]
MYVILLGLPGAGKGTQAAHLSKTKGLPHITTGELFRENIRLGTELGLKAKPFYDAGQLVPDELTIGMLVDRIGQPDCRRGCLFDGFPRTLEQAKALDEALASRGMAIGRAIYIKVPTDELVRRLAGRWNCRQCGAVYHQASRPPKAAGVCDNCGAQLYQRPDDRPDVVRTRLEVNLAGLQTLLSYYCQQGKLVEVQGRGDVDAIGHEIEGLLGD